MPPFASLTGSPLKLSLRKRFPNHLLTGRRGEEAAYFYLRRLGYMMVARNFRTPRRRGEIDLIGWHKDILCFVEVKTRTTHEVKPAEAAVDRDKRRDSSAWPGNTCVNLPPSCRGVSMSSACIMTSIPASLSLSCSGTFLPCRKISSFVCLRLRKGLRCLNLEKIRSWVAGSLSRPTGPSAHPILLREGVRIRGGFCPFCYGNESQNSA